MLALLITSFAIEAKAQSVSRLQFSASLGSRGTSTEVSNLFGESVSRFERSVDLVFGEVVYQKNERVKLWARYSSGFNPGDYIFAGLDRAQSALYLGGQARTQAYVATVQYGYQSLQDSLYHDVLWTEHAYLLSSGITPTLTTWVGMGKQIDFEWMLRSGIKLPLHQHFALEPMLMLSDDDVQSKTRKYLGVTTHISMPEKGYLSLGVSRQISQGRKNGIAFLCSGTVPFIHQHKIIFSVQRNSIGNVHTTLFALGMTLSLI